MRFMRLHKRPLVAALLATGLSTTTIGASAADWQIGRGIHDITGPAAELGMLGYASLEQISAGIHTRLHARAFIFAEQDDPSQRVVMVSADLGMVMQSVKQGVVKKLKAKYGDLYGHANVMLSPTHTHAGPGGISHYALSNLTSFGFNQQNFDVIVDGLVAAIEQAHNNLSPGQVSINAGDLFEASINRSLDAYQANPQSERDQYTDTVDRQMTLLKMQKNGQDYGMWNWFAVHPVSMTNENKLISADNKGYASYLFERDMGLEYPEREGFVAAFAQSNAGDVSPNLNLDGTGPGVDEFDNTRIIGQRQYEAAKQIYQDASQPLTGDIAWRHTFVDMSALSVDQTYSHQANSTTCKAALGYAMAAGTEDGRGPDIFVEGDNPENPLFTVLMSLIGVATDELRACQAEKQILLATGVVKPVPWTPDVLPLQLFKLGSLAVVAVPSEITTMAGRRLAATVKQELGDTVDQVVISGLANTWASYVTTREEYAAQNYEGGHTLFGPHTLAGYQQEFARLARAIKQDQPVPPGPALRDLANRQLSFQPGVLLDNVPFGQHFGAVHQQPAPRYVAGQQVSASFWTGHPKNDLKTQSSYLEIQRKAGWHWQTIATDNDWQTFYEWQRIDGFWGTSRANIRWQIPNDVEPGTYRIKHNGAYKNGWTGNIHSFSGISRTFVVID